MLVLITRVVTWEIPYFQKSHMLKQYLAWPLSVPTHPSTDSNIYWATEAAAETTTVKTSG